MRMSVLQCIIVMTSLGPGLACARQCSRRSDLRSTSRSQPSHVTVAALVTAVTTSKFSPFWILKPVLDSFQQAACDDAKQWIFTTVEMIQSGH